jgi:hypothetical protein
MILTLMLLIGTPDYACTTDLDCLCKQVPYETSNDSKECIEYRKVSKK